MPLGAGDRLGPYEIVEPLGAGGMGEVYHARDSRLHRDVAIKILAESLRGDATRRERFEREARIVSSLNHPNICSLYDVGRDDDHDFLVLEYLEGEPLDRRLGVLKGRPLPLRQALAIAMQIADALDKAHRAGVVHRDLKPQNIFVTKNGAKLLDFGLAKIAGAAEPALPPITQSTTSRELTVDGTIVGTFLYMAPEQLAGRPADARTDIYAFGLVLYEMLTGGRPFEDRADTGVITAVFEREPPPLVLAGLSGALPASLDRIVRTCLAKDPDDRIQSAHDVLLQLRWAMEEAADGDGRRSSATLGPVKAWRIATAVAAVSAVGLGVRVLLAPHEPSPPIARFAYVMPADQTFTRAGRRSLAISRDGTRLVYSANGQLYLKGIADLDAAPILGTDDDPTDPSFSPSGDEIVFWSRRTGEIRTIPVSGGASKPVAKTLNPWGSSWTGTRLLVSQGRDGIFEIPAAGGEQRVLVRAVNGESLYGPELLADGETLIFAAKPATTSRWDDAAIVAQSLKTGARKVLVQRGTDAHVAPGMLLYVREATIMGVRFDASTLVVTGAPVPLVKGVAQASSNITGAGFYGFSATGTLVYIGGDEGQPRTLVFVDRQGHETPVPAPPKPYMQVRLSPDGTALALETRELDSDVWTWDLNQERLTRVTSTRDDERMPMWTKDGRQLVYVSNKGGSIGLFRTPADGTGTTERLTTSPDLQAPLVVAPDGRTLVFCQLRSGTALYELKLLDLVGGGAPRPMSTLPFTEPSIVFSPDGRWIAYASNESGRYDIYVQRYPSQDGAPIQVSSNGGVNPVWTRNGREILYLDLSRRMTSVAVKSDDTFAAGKPEALFTANYYTAQFGRAFDVSPDGKTFVMIKEPASARQFVFVQHWLDDAAGRLR